MDEPAFPRSHAHDGHNGISLRDYFAAKAMQGFCSGGTKGDPLDSIADLAYRMADAMMAARTAGVTASQECPRCGGREWIWDIAEGRQTSKVPCPSCGVPACPHGVPHRWPCEQCDAAGVRVGHAPSEFKLVGKADFHMSAEMDVVIGTDLYIRTAGVDLPDGGRDGL